MSKRILILDDNQDILDIVHETLTYEKFDVKSTGESADVIPLVENFNPDLVILDYRVAGTNGGELCRHGRWHSLLPAVQNRRQPLGDPRWAQERTP